MQPGVRIIVALELLPSGSTLRSKEHGHTSSSGARTSVGRGRETGRQDEKLFERALLRAEPPRLCNSDFLQLVSGEFSGQQIRFVVQTRHVPLSRAPTDIPVTLVVHEGERVQEAERLSQRGGDRS